MGITNDVWFIWTAAATGTATLSLCGGTSMDSKIAVYAGGGCPAGAALACNDDSCGVQSQLSFAATAGTQYTIQIGNFPGAAGSSGTFVLCVAAPQCDLVPGECCGGRPSFDDPAYASFGNLVSVGTASPDADGTAVVAVFNLVNPNGGPFNTDFGAPIYSHASWSQNTLGSVFGVALDPAGNVYVAATTCYYSDMIGSLVGSGPGTVYKLDTNTSVASVFVTIPNSGPALGNICYDCEHDQFFVSSMDDGRIYRISAAGVILDGFDFGAPDNPSNVFPPLGDRVWAVQKHNGRLYFSVWWVDAGHPSTTQANEIWSIALNGSGDFSGVPRLEISMPPLSGSNYSNPVSDMRFTPTGAMLVAERGMSDQTTPVPHQARLLEFECVNGFWAPSTNIFSVGSIGSHINSAGGVDVDPDVGGRVYVTGDALQLGPQTIYGTQGLPATGGTVANSILVDFNGNLSLQDKTFIGDVAIPCMRCGPNPLAYYKFDDALNIGHDASGNGHDGVLGAATIVAGACGNALNFLPNNNVHEFTIPAASDLNLTGAMTGMALIRPLGQQSTDNNPSCTEGTIFSKGGNYWFQVEKNNNRLVFQNEGSGTDLAVANIGLCIGQWTHVAFVRAADGKTIRFFKNGLPIGTPTTLVNAATANSDFVMVGNYGFGNSPAACEFNGDLDEIRIYDQALSDSEVLAAYLCACPVAACSPPIGPYCFPGESGTLACPCANPPFASGSGCNNSSATGGAVLSGAGTASLSADTLVFTTQAEKATATSIVLQGTASVPGGLVFGQGVRCVAGNLKRLYVKIAVGGSISAPQGGDPTVSARSAALGDPIGAGQQRYYAVYYRDPIVLGACPAASTFNVTQSGAVTWTP
jgi:hypothetical protein